MRDGIRDTVKLTKLIIAISMINTAIVNREYTVA